jgi:hypothetical protein
MYSIIPVDILYTGSVQRYELAILALIGVPLIKRARQVSIAVAIACAVHAQSSAVRSILACCMLV